MGDHHANESWSASVTRDGVTRVGVIGLGDIGRGVAENMVKAGLELTVCDVRREACAQFENRAGIASSSGELAAASDVIVIAVVNDSQVESVMIGPDGIVAGDPRGKSILVLSTISTDTVRRMASVASDAGASLVDCGVSGGPAAAAEGQLVAMVGGTDDAIALVRPVLEAFASTIIHMGPAGAGLQAKLARNIVQYGSWLAAFEAQLLAEAAGIPLQKLAEAVKKSDEKIGGASRLMFRETVAPFPPDTNALLIDAMAAGAGLAHKDLTAALALAADLGVSLPMTELTSEMCDRIFGLGGGDR